jgi:hypothetical protein
MNDLRGLSKLPEDDAYWAALEARMVAAATGSIVEPMLVPASPPWHAPLAQSAWRLGAVAAAAGAMFFLLPPRAPAEAAQPPSLSSLPLLVAPSGVPSTLSSIVSDAEAPALAALLLPPSSAGTP